MIEALSVTCGRLSAFARATLRLNPVTTGGVEWAGVLAEVKTVQDTR